MCLDLIKGKRRRTDSPYFFRQRTATCVTSSARARVSWGRTASAGVRLRSARAVTPTSSAPPLPEAATRVAILEATPEATPGGSNWGNQGSSTGQGTGELWPINCSVS